MHRLMAAYISFGLAITCPAVAMATEETGDSLAPATPVTVVHTSLISGNVGATSGLAAAQPEQNSGFAYSEQLRIYDQPVPVVRIAIPSATAKPVRTRRGGLAAGAETFRPMIDDVGRQYEIDPRLIRSIADVESRHNPRAVSPKGARGLMQVMPALARRFGVNETADLTDPAVNLGIAAKYLKSLQGRYGNNLPLILAAYNAGEGAVQKYGTAIPPYRETQDYVRKVLALYEEALAGR